LSSRAAARSGLWVRGRYFRGSGWSQPATPSSANVIGSALEGATGLLLMAMPRQRATTEETSAVDRRAAVDAAAPDRLAAWDEGIGQLFEPQPRRDRLAGAERQSLTRAERRQEAEQAVGRILHRGMDDALILEVRHAHRKHRAAL
jgi:hypothetical protein